MNPAAGAWRAELDRRLTAHRVRQAERCPELRRVTLALPLQAVAAAPCAPILLPAAGVREPVAEPMRRAAVAPPSRPESWSTVVAAPPNPGIQNHPAPAPLWSPQMAGPALAEPAYIAPRRMSAVPLRTVGPAAVLRIPLPLAAPRVAAAANLPARVQPAPRSRRLAAGLFDSGIVTAAALCFGFAAWAAGGFAGPDAHTLRHLLPACAGVPLLMAGLYRFVSAAAGASLGMQRQGLELAGFDGPPTPRARRRRAIFGLLSLAALGGGFLWMFLDSDRLTWHDYISRTYPRQV